MWTWHYSTFKVSPLEKLFSIFSNSFLTSSNFSPQIFHYSTHTNIFIINFSSSSPLLKSFSSTISIFSYLLTSTFIFLSNSSKASPAFFKFSFLFHIFLSAVNPFYCTKYFSTPLIFFLFKIFFTFHSLTSSTSIGISSSFFCPLTCSLYYTIQLTLTTGCILIKVGNYSLTMFDETTSSIIYSPTYLSINFLIGLSLNTKSLVLNSTLSLFYYDLHISLSLSISFLMLPLLSCILSLFFLQTLSHFLSFSFSWYLLPFSILFYSLP